MSTTYRPSRNIEASIIDFLQTNFDTDWSNVNVEKGFSRAYEIDLPVVAVRINTTSHTKAELGGDSTVREVQVLIDIFCTSDGQKEDFCDYIVSKIKSGCPYYDYVIANGAVQSKTQDGRLRFTGIEVSPIEFDTEKSKLDPHDRYRALITLTVSRGKVEA